MLSKGLLLYTKLFVGSIVTKAAPASLVLNGDPDIGVKEPELFTVKPEIALEPVSAAYKKEPVESMIRPEG